MHSVLKKNISYNSTILFLTLMTVLFGFCCMLLGYVFLAPAASFYALLIWYERADRRILTYVIPGILFVINFFVNGLFSLEAIAYVALGILIYFCYKRGVSKGESAFFAMLLSMLLVALSMLFLAFNSKGAVSGAAITQYYSELFNTCKNSFLDLVTSVVQADEDGVLHYVFNFYEAELIFHEIVILCIPTLIIFVFAMVGVTFKIFSANMRKYSGDEKTIDEWNFGVSNLVAYFYVAVAVLSIFTSGFDGVFPLVVVTLDSILCVVLAYLGFTFLYNLISIRRSSFFAVAVIIVACMIFSAIAFRLLSLIGVYYAVAANKVNKSRGK